MKTLDQHNAERRDAHKAANTYPKPNGIACPKCGSEMCDSDPFTLASNPPQRNVHCPECNFRGYRID